MDGHRYEYQCANILKNKGFTNVTVTKGSGDQGIDIIAYGNGRKYGIQCKYYASPVGNHAVQEAYAGARYYNCEIAAVMTNNDFTKSAIELSNKTGVMLWGKNKAPSMKKSFPPTKYIGVFFLIIGIWGIISGKSKEVKFHSLQTIQLALFIIGGFFGTFEYKSWGMDFIASVLYLFSAIIEVFFSVSVDSVRIFSGLLFILFSLLTFMRSDYLHLKTNGYHIWKNGFKNFISDNFNVNKKNKALKNTVKTEYLRDKEELNKLDLEIENQMKKIGSLYVEYFKERFHVNCVLEKCSLVGDRDTEFIFKCEMPSQANRLSEKESELNNSFNNKHKITELSNNYISIMVIRE